MEDLSLKDFLGFDPGCARTTTRSSASTSSATFKKGVKYDAEGTGLGWENTATILARTSISPTPAR